MARIRAFENAAEKASKGGVAAFGASLSPAASQPAVRGPLHLSTGQEAVAAGVCANLGREDYITSTHRGHGHTLAKGASMERTMGELFGRATGFNGGKGGSMHIADFSVGMLGANGVVAAGIPIAVGAAHAIKIQGLKRVVCCFFGDGAISRGPFLEGLNWAKVHELPLLFVCEDNRWSATTATEAMTAGEGALARAQSIGVTGMEVDGNDVFQVDEAAGKLLERIRNGEGPQFLHAITYRFKGHVSVDPATYRDGEEVSRALQTDPLKLAGNKLGESRAASISKEAEDEVRKALEAAAAAPWPQPDAAYTDIQDAGSGPVAVMTYAAAACDAVREAMRRDERVVVLGEDVGRGGIFHQYRGLQQEFGAGRVIDTPISESTIMGAAVGMALAGMKPVVEMRVVDFALCAMDEIVNQAAKGRYMLGGQGWVALVARMPVGLWSGSAAQHSQSLEAWFAHVPGLVVVAPSTPQDNRALLEAAIGCGDSVVHLEHKELWGLQGEVRSEKAELGKAKIIRKGAEITLVTWSRTVHEALAAAEKAPMSVEVIDLRTLWPWDRETVLGSAAKTKRLLVAHEAVQAAGFGAEIAATAAEALGIQVRRVGAPRIPVGYSSPLEDEARVGAKRILSGLNAFS